MRTVAPETRLSRHFVLGELTRSSTARRNGIVIEVTVDSPVHRALIALVDCILQPLRNHLGEPVHVTSGYRPRQVNELVGGAADSQHTLGQAADIGVGSLAPVDLARRIVELDLAYDQVIVEFDRWVHVSYSPLHRRQQLTAYTGIEGGVQYAPRLHSAATIQKEHTS